jgi:glucosylceramidase
MQMVRMKTSKLTHGLLTGILLCAASTSHAECSGGQIESWITTPDRSQLMARQASCIAFAAQSDDSAVPIVVDEQQSFQPIDGYGFALTWGSALHLHAMSAAARQQLLRELFGTDGAGVGMSYLRLTLGASDLNSFVYSYDDLPRGKVDPPLEHFSLGHDHDHVIPVLKEILQIAPQLRILASPWSAPVWMKTNGQARGGSLKPEYYDAYARYFVRYVLEMRKLGVTIDAVTVQNESLNFKNTPSMVFSLQEQASFVRDHLGPAFAAAGLTTKILVFDHNLDRPEYPLAILSDAEAAKYIDGSAFHHYGGDMQTLSMVHMARPDKNIYFTEQMVIEEPRSATIDVVAEVKRLVVGTMRNWSRNLVLWNLASDARNEPHTDDGGCTMCQGALTIERDSVTRNLAYYTVAHASKFVRPGSTRIYSTDAADMAVVMTTDEDRPQVHRATLVPHSGVLSNVAFRTPDRRIVLIVANDSWNASSVRVQYQGRWATLPLRPGAVGTFVWGQ